MLLIGEGLKRELRDGEFSLSQLDETIEHGGDIAKAGRQVLLQVMKDFFEMIDDSDHTENTLNHHVLIAFTALTKSPVDGVFSALGEPQVAENFRLLGPCASDLLEVLVMRVGGCTLPVNDLAL